MAKPYSQKAKLKNSQFAISTIYSQSLSLYMSHKMLCLWHWYTSKDSLSLSHSWPPALWLSHRPLAASSCSVINLSKLYRFQIHIALETLDTVLFKKAPSRVPQKCPHSPSTWHPCPLKTPVQWVAPKPSRSYSLPPPPTSSSQKPIIVTGSLSSCPIWSSAHYFTVPLSAVFLSNTTPRAMTAAAFFLDIKQSSSSPLSSYFAIFHTNLETVTNWSSRPKTYQYFAACS